MTNQLLARCRRVLDDTDDLRMLGIVTRVVGLTIEALGPSASVGELCLVTQTGSGQPVPAEVVGFQDRKVLLMPLGELEGIGPGCKVVAARRPLTVPVGFSLLGRVLDGLGRPLDSRGPVEQAVEFPVHSSPLNPLERQRIAEPLSVGVRAIDGLLTCGKGQRLGIFAGSGVGKSTLLGMMARNTSADVTVIGLIGERGREVREFIERDLGPAGQKRSVVVAATSDQPPLVRIKGAYVATAIAEFFREQGLDVLLLMDSVTRFALAQREVGLAAGEPPATRGYPPSVFTTLPRLLERTGPGSRGTITAFYTVLVEGDDLNEPISDAVRGILDGHVVLSRDLANRNHFPAIDVLGSVSRLMNDIVPAPVQRAAGVVRTALARYREMEDLINIGAYQEGSSPEVDFAIAHRKPIMQFLAQDVEESCDLEETWQVLTSLVPSKAGSGVDS